MTIKTKEQLLKNSQDLTKAIINYKGFGITHSLAIAEQFGKQHKHVMRDIREFVKKVEIEDGATFGLSSENVDMIGFCKEWSKKDNSYMVKELHYLNEQNKEQSFYMVSKKVAIGLIMAYNGQKAFKVRLQILDRFDELEKEQVDKKVEYAGSKGGYKGQFNRVKQENDKLIEENKKLKLLAELSETKLKAVFELIEELKKV